MKTITKGELLGMLMSNKRCMPVDIKTTTEVKMRKRGNPYIGTKKTKHTNGMINFKYENSVNSKLIKNGKEGDFKVSERKWGKHVTQSIIEHKGNYYLQVRVNKVYDVEYNNEGNKITKQQLAPFLPSKIKSSNDIIINDIKIDNIESITINKKRYIVK